MLYERRNIRLRKAPTLIERRYNSGEIFGRDGRRGDQRAEGKLSRTRLWLKVFAASPVFGSAAARNAFIPTSRSFWTYVLLLGGELPAVLPVPGSTAAPAVFIGASPMNLFEPKHRARRTAPRARARVLPETAETLTREV